MPIDNSGCPLCRSSRTGEYSADRRRTYLRCNECCLVFVPSAHRLSPEDEKKRYDLHRNAPEDTGYLRFLNRLFLPLCERMSPGSCGLDFGSGPEPVLGRMFEDAGYPMMLFDPFYRNEPAALEKQYDFITACEVVEHLREPRQELDRLWACLKSGGWLGIMTRFCVDPTAFPAWHYKNDLTHICFFARETFAWLASEWKAELIIQGDDAVLFRKGALAGPT